jgi:glycosyltransferase involved in cell wall biosynthesis
MWKEQTVSVVLPTYREKDSIRQAIVDLFATGVVDEVIAVNNNAAAGTSEEIAGTGAREVFEPRQGYGFACRCGLSRATGDLVILFEPDGTFRGSDVLKLLVYHDDGYDVVFGTRTTKGLIWEGANMGPALKWGNVIVAKLLEVLFLTPFQLTDVGCTLRLVRRDILDRITGAFRVGGSHFGVEFMLYAINSGASCIEIPVNYLPRVGESQVTASFVKTAVLALRMIAFTLAYRFRTLVDKLR